VTGSFEQLAYEAALRRLDKQESVLNEVRARTGILLAASSLAASFLGRDALERPASTVIAVLALLAFVVSIGASVYVLIPRRDQFVFALTGSAVYEELYGFRKELLHRRLAYDLGRFWDANNPRIAKLFRAFFVGATALVLEVVLLAGLLGGTIG
jgi:hypothetical protein